MTDRRAELLRIGALALEGLGLAGLAAGIVAAPWLLGFATGVVGAGAALQGVGQVVYPDARANTTAGQRRRRYGGVFLVIVGLTFLAIGVWYGLT